jgi:hypothetical protein
MNTQSSTAPTPTVTDIKISSLDSVHITTSDGVTHDAGSIANAIANKNAPVQQLHDVLTGFHTAAIAAAKQAGSDAATKAMEPAHLFLSSLFAKGVLTPTDIAAGAAAVADANQGSRERKLAKAHKAVAEAAAALAKLQAEPVS